MRGRFSLLRGCEGGELMGLESSREKTLRWGLLGGATR